jgi:hypothetical protein
MKCILLLLAGAALCGAEIGVKIFGVTTDGDPCSEEEGELLYKECVEDVAASMGVILSRRLELRGGNRDLQTGSTCTTCCQYCPSCIMSDCYPLGTWCLTYCSARRLVVADEPLHPEERLLVVKGQIQNAAYVCLIRKIKVEGYKCLGHPEDLTIQMFLSE